MKNKKKLQKFSTFDTRQIRPKESLVELDDFYDRDNEMARPTIYNDVKIN